MQRFASALLSLGLALGVPACFNDASGSRSTPGPRDSPPQAAAPRYTADPRCPVHPRLVPEFRTSARTVSALREGRPVTIVAIGSSSTSGVGTSSPDRGYPEQLQRQIASRWPASRVRVVNAGIGGQTAAQMVARFARDVHAHRPDLVIWQTGTIEAISGEPLGPFFQRLRTQAAALVQQGYDVAILDSQYYTGVGQSAPFAALQDSMHAVAAETGAVPVKRYAMMRHLVATGRYKPDQLLWTDQFHMSDTGYLCTALLLVYGLESAAKVN